MGDKITITLILIVSISIVIGPVLFFSFTGFLSDDMARSYEFCSDQGHDGVNIFGGIYSEYYGQVECYSGFKDKNIYEIFNVTEDWKNEFKIKGEKDVE